jgi:hypothetical protein
MSTSPAFSLLCRTCVALALLAVSAPLAQAGGTRVFVGVGFGGPLYYPPPVYYYPPPVYYPPPAVVYAPPPGWGTPPVVPGPAHSCYAGRYVCPMSRPVPVGATCWCTNNSGGRAYGTAN